MLEHPSIINENISLLLELLSNEPVRSSTSVAALCNSSQLEQYAQCHILHGDIFHHSFLIIHVLTCALMVMSML